MSKPQQSTESQLFEERRALERSYEEMDAVYLPDDGAKVPCRILDFSMMGACVSFNEPRVIPDEISIHVPKFGLTYVGEVRWRRENEAGLLFSSAMRAQID